MSLEDLEKRLYKSGENFKERERKNSFIKDKNSDVSVSPVWIEKEAIFETPQEMLAASKEIEQKMKKNKRIKIIIFITAAILFFVGAAGFFVYKFYFKWGGLGFLSVENMKIEIKGPENINAGERFSLPIYVLNKNKSAVYDANLIIEYSEGVEIINKNSTTPFKERIFMDKILPGEEAEEIINLFIFGEANSVKEIRATLEYKVENSSAIFEKEETKKITISNSAVAINIEAPQEIGMNKETDFKIDIISNSNIVLKGLVMDIEYPEMFVLKDAFPRPSLNEKRWNLGDMASGEKKSVVIKGIVASRDILPEEVIKVSVGVLSEEREINLYAVKTVSFSVRKLFLNAAIKVDGVSGEGVSQDGKTVEMKVEWENNLAVGVKNAVLEAKIENGADYIDIPSLRIENGGSFNSFTNSIVWDFVNNRKFSFIESGEKGSVIFYVKLKDKIQTRSVADKNFSVDLSVKFYTNYIPEEYKDTEISGSDKITIKIASNFQFSQKGFYSMGLFRNTGPIPPKAGQETTYTIKWSLVNSYNDLSDVVVEATLPNYVKWTNNVSSEYGEVFYDEESRNVKWKIKLLEAGSGFVSPAREASFQILLLPAEAHIGASPSLIYQAKAVARDNFAAAILEDTEESITTELRNDPAVGRDKGVVIK